MLDQQSKASKVSAGSASTNGWDTVFAIEFADVNRAIEASGNYATSFDHEQTGTSGTGRVYGSFSAWEMTGGADQNIIMTLPIPQFFFDFTSETTIERTDAWLRIQVALDRIPRKLVGADGMGSLIDFRTALKNSNGTDVVQVDGFGWPGSDDPSHPDYDPELEADVKVLLADWFRQSENLSYAVKELADERVGAFGILCMTEDREAPENQTLNANILEEGKAGLLINKDRFLEKFIKPGLGMMFSNDGASDWVDSHFALSESGTSITNTAAVHIDDFSLKESEQVRADLPVGGFNATLEDTYLEISYDDLSHPFFHVIDYWYTAHHDLTVRATVELDDEGNFLLIPGRDPDDKEAMKHNVVLEEGPLAEAAKWTMIALSIAGAFGTIANGIRTARAAAAAAPAAGAVAGTVANVGAVGTATTREWLRAGIATIRAGFASLVAWVRAHPAYLYGLIAATIMGVGAPLVKSFLEDQTEENPDRVKPNIEDFAVQIMQPVQWPSNTGFDVTSIAFNGGFHILGDAKFDS